MNTKKGLAIAMASVLASALCIGVLIIIVIITK